MRVVHSQRGMVLLVVLASVALISTLLYSGVEGQRFQIYRVENELNMQQALLMARSAQPEVLRLLNSQKTENGEPFIDSMNSAWAQPVLLPWDEEGKVTIEIVDLARFINVNSLVDSSGTLSTEVRGRLERMLAASELPVDEMVEPLIDWLDADEERSGVYGAEKGDYLSMGLPYAPTNGPLYQLEELALVKGWDKETLQLLNGTLIANLTCRDLAINVNTAGEETLRAALETLLPTDIDTILLQREEAPYSDSADFWKRLHVSDDGTSLTFSSACYNAKVSASVGKVKGVIEFTVQKNDKGQYVVAE